MNNELTATKRLLEETIVKVKLMKQEIDDIQKRGGRMKRYKLKKDLPAFKAGTKCYIEEAGNMVPCRGISYIIVHKDQLEENPNILDDWFEEIKEPTRWKPEKYNEPCYFINALGMVGEDIWRDSVSVDREKFNLGNLFQTKEEAERVVEYLKALAVVRGDSTSKFVNGEYNWFVYFDIEKGLLFPDTTSYLILNGVFGLPYFATEEDAKRSIEEHKKEWLTIFGIEEEK